MFIWNGTVNVILIWNGGVLLRPRGKLILEYFQNHGLVWEGVYYADANTNSIVVYALSAWNVEKNTVIYGNYTCAILLRLINYGCVYMT